MHIYLAVLVILTLALPLQAGQSGSELIAGMEKLMWGTTTHGRFAMTIKTQYWQRQLELEAWLNRPGKTFIRIHAPRKEKGIGSLRIGAEMWNYLPKVDRTIKIPPSMMLQPWMGSDFSNDDLVKESSLENDYVHEIADTNIQNGKTLYHVVSTPKSQAPVVWGKLEFLIFSDFIPLRQTFYDDQNKVVKSMHYSDVKTMDGREIPTRWRMKPVEKPDQFTENVVNELTFDRSLEDNIFTLRNLRNP